MSYIPINPLCPKQIVYVQACDYNYLQMQMDIPIKMIVFY